MFAIIVLQQDDGLTLREVMDGIPMDAQGLVVFILIAVSAFLIWRGSRSKKRT